MISPIIRPCRVIPASHSGQCAMSCVPPSIDEISRTYVKQQKTLFILRFREGRRATFVEQDATLVVPPSFVDVLQHQPRCRVTPYRPDHGGHRQRSTFAPGDFFSQLRGLFHSRLTYGLSTTRPLSVCNQELLLAPSRLLLYVIVRFFLAMR